MMDKFKMNGKALLFPALASVTAAGSSVVAFAADAGGGPALELPKINITTEMLSPLVEGLVANINVVLPVGLGIMGLMLGIRIVPSVLRRFTGA